MDTAYRRRITGRGRRVAGRTAPRGGQERERRRLVQLGVSVALFLLVYFGRGILPRQAALWQEMLAADMDLGGAVTAFRDALADGGAPGQALEAFWGALSGLPAEEGGGQQAEEDARQPAEPDEEPGASPVMPALPAYHERPSITEFGLSAELLRQPVSDEIPAAGGEHGAGMDGAAGVPDEPVVPAVAQAYTEDGQALPANVSLQYYNLGLAETAVPVEGRVTSDFYFRDHPINGVYGFHTALDIGAPQGEEIGAFAAGTVELAGENSVAGLYVQVDHGSGVKTFYAHCSQLLVKQGDTVACGEAIALVGETGDATGPHLHFVLEKDGIRLDPALYLDLA